MDTGLKVVVIGGGLFVAALVVVGLMLNAGENERVEAAKKASDARMQPFHTAMDQAKKAQEMQRRQRLMMEAEMMEVEGYPVEGEMYGVAPAESPYGR